MSSQHGAVRQDIACNVCGKPFTKEMHLRTHIRVVHKKQFKFNCTLCEKGFVSKPDMEGHMNTHRGIRPYACHYCASAFSYRKHLTAHMRSKHIQHL